VSKYEAERKRIRNTIDLFVSKGIPKRAIKSILSEIFDYNIERELGKGASAHDGIKIRTYFLAERQKMDDYIDGCEKP
jgi:hypothetical protein